MKVHDGQLYNNDEPVWDLGSFVCVGVEVEGNVRSYEGLSADTPKLPKYDNLGSGSKATCLDNGAYLKYHAPTKSWYEQ